MATWLTHHVFHRRLANCCCLDAQRAGAEVGVEGGVEAHIFHVALLVAAVEITVAGDAAQAPKVLVLAVTAVAPAHHLHRYHVLTRHNHGCDIELCRHLAVLAVAGKLAVDPQIDARCRRADVRNHLLAFPLGRHLDGAAVTAHMVVADGHLRRVVLEMAAPCKADVDVHRVAVAVQLPHARHGHCRPAAHVVVLAEEVGWALVGIGYPIKFPQAVERNKAGRVAPVVGCGKRLAFVGKKVGVRRQAVHRVHLQVVPLGERHALVAAQCCKA